jgi:sugar phosphate isomerase/epimerase
MNRRNFIRQTGLMSAGMAFALNNNIFANPEKNKLFFKISLAQWSLHRMLQNGGLLHLDFPLYTKKKFDIDAVEYVSSFFKGQTDTAYLNELNKRCNDNGVKSLLIMVDGEGNLGELDKETRLKSVENHYKWVDAAAYLGCHSIRVNAGGKGTMEEVADAVIDGLSQLTDYGAKAGINIIVENHGGYSSNGKWLANVIASVSHPYCGTLPDFGNFKISSDEFYDKYLGVEELMPFAKGVSAKSNNFDDAGNEIDIDYVKMLQIVKNAGYTGYIGIEYEGKVLPEQEGIMVTKKLLEKVGVIV